MAKVIENIIEKIQISVLIDRRNSCKNCEFRSEDTCTKCDCLTESKVFTDCPKGLW